MDETGITMQVLAVSGAGADLLDVEKGPALARDYNNALAQKMKIWKNCARKRRQTSEVTLLTYLESCVSKIRLKQIKRRFSIRV